ncbi:MULTISPECIES: hypothetical protein [unclassified Polaribacter]|uniref:hypothetical protein n=1 Tax=unclassified Polaribacter TaxID=196858 RepID=UPI0011BEF922|nr:MULTISPECIES: hypothetical protein [unclassified Polaribacter]TXD50186.1 hypothetical protein ES043_16945 [Polaribacter sp. IC063]TXD56128.1 hypothetical protein ES044_17350 [Polaribacter sp. IC066]
MSNIGKSHDFEKSQNKLREFSKNIPEKTNFKSFEEDSGIFGMFNHKVTGSELNIFVNDVQDELINQKQVSIKIIREFETIYNTFDSLDKEYIQSILIAQNSAEVASKHALDSAKRAEQNTKALQLLVKKLQEKRKILGIDGNLDVINKKLASRINLLTILSIVSITFSIGLSIFIFLK